MQAQIICEKEIPHEYRNEFFTEFIHNILQGLGYDTSDLDLTQCLDLSTQNDYRCFWRDLVIILSRDYSKLTIIRRTQNKIHEIDLNPLYDEFNVTYFDLMRILMSKYRFAVVGISTDTGNIDVDFASNEELHRIASEFRDLLKELYRKVYVEESISFDEFDEKIEEFAKKHNVDIYRVLEYDTAYFILPKDDREYKPKEDIVKTWKTGNSIVIAIPAKPGKYFSRKKLPDGTIILEPFH